MVALMTVPALRPLLFGAASLAVVAGPVMSSCPPAMADAHPPGTRQATSGVCSSMPPTPPVSYA